MNAEQRLAHYGYEVTPYGQHWMFGPHGRGALLSTRELAVTRALGALDLELGRAEHLMRLQATELVAA